MAIQKLVFIDETGTLLNPKEDRPYGLGFCHINREFVDEVHELLKQNNLDQIHISQVRSDEEKIRIAEAIGKLNLERFGVRGGAVIQPDPRHANDFMLTYFYNDMARRPEIALEAIERAIDAGPLRKRTILGPNDIFPNIRKTSRLTEFMKLSMRFPFISVLNQHGLNNPIQLEYWFSAIGEMNRYKKQLEQAYPNGEEDISLFIERLHSSGLLKDYPQEPVKLSARIIAYAGGIFGLTDLFAAVGHLSVSKEENKRQLAKQIHERITPLHSNLNPYGRGELPGIAILNSSDGTTSAIEFLSGKRRADMGKLNR